LNDVPVRVLVVDDLPRVRDALATLLATFGEVEVAGVATDGRDALQKARGLRPDVVLMDLEMPVVDGFTATAAIVAEGLAAVVVLSIHSHAGARAKAFAAGASAFVEKGAKPEVLLHALLDAASQRACALRRLATIQPGNAPQKDASWT
jgi:DNA-binding NarL/FixJ family response regulator